MQELIDYLIEMNSTTMRYDVPSYEPLEIKEQLLSEFLEEYGEDVSMAYPRVEGFYPVFIAKGKCQNIQGILTVQLTIIDDEEVMPRLAYICGTKMMAVKK